MNLTLTLVGAGEYTSFLEGKTSTYLRFRADTGAEFDLTCTPEQLSVLLSFAAAPHVSEPAATPTPELYPSLVSSETLDDPADEGVLRLRGLSQFSPFAAPDDDNL